MAPMQETHMVEVQPSAAGRRQRRVAMICTGARGGMRSVVEGYRADGLFDRWNVELLESHAEGGLGLRMGLAFRSLMRLLWLLLTRQVALVHCHAAMRGSFWRKSIFALLARGAGVPVLFHLHGSEMQGFVGSLPAPLRRLVGWILARQTSVIVLSQSWATYVKAIAPRAKVEILHNYVALPDLSTRAPRDVGRVNLLFLGLVGHRKGVFDLLPAMAEVLKQHPSVHLTLGGNGEVERARSLVQELGIAHAVTLAGWVGGEDKLRYLRCADVYVLPSHNEGLPMSLLEAMSWGVPVISTRVGGIPELVRDGEDGLLVNAGNPQALAAAIGHLAGNPAERERMGACARSRVEGGFSREAVLPRLDAIYEMFCKAA